MFTYIDIHSPIYWNGERYNIDCKHTLWPIYGDEDEYGCIPIIGLEIR